MMTMKTKEGRGRRQPDLVTGRGAGREQGRGGFHWKVRGVESQALSLVSVVAVAAAERMHPLTGHQRVGQSPL